MIVTRNLRALGLGGAAALFGAAFLVLTLVMAVMAGRMVKERLSVREAPARPGSPASGQSAPSVPEEIEARSFFRLSFQAGAFALAALAARVQRARYRAFVAGGGRPRPLLKTGFLVFLATLPVYLVIIGIGWALARGG